MLKQTVSYENFDGHTVTEDLYFNITKTELANEIEKAEEIARLQTMFDGPQRELSAGEVKKLLELIKWLVKLSYGVRSEDGKRFVKTPQVWEEFTQTAAYDAFLFGLFEQPERAVQFMIGVVPKDLRGDVEKKTMQRMAELKQQGQVVTQEAVDETRASEMLNEQLPAGNVFQNVQAEDAPVAPKMPTYEELLAEHQKNQQG